MEEIRRSIIVGANNTAAIGITESRALAVQLRHTFGQPIYITSFLLTFDAVADQGKIIVKELKDGVSGRPIIVGDVSAAAVGCDRLGVKPHHWISLEYEIPLAAGRSLDLYIDTRALAAQIEIGELFFQARGYQIEER
ncbi:MAG: hypothetical protein KDG50_03215 [Chromatiales bacterium]|nr:hypothetical protein [Chromatiales bacterium]